MRDFIPLTYTEFSVTHWLVSIEWGIADDFELIEESAISRQEYSRSEIEKLYAKVFQTVDGELIAYDRDVEVVCFRAEDSSFWEITSTKGDFLEKLRNMCGEYSVSAT